MSAPFDTLCVLVDKSLHLATSAPFDTLCALVDRSLKNIGGVGGAESTMSGHQGLQSTPKKCWCFTEFSSISFHDLSRVAFENSSTLVSNVKLFCVKQSCLQNSFCMWQVTCKNWSKNTWFDSTVHIKWQGIIWNKIPHLDYKTRLLNHTNSSKTLHVHHVTDSTCVLSIYLHAVYSPPSTMWGNMMEGEPLCNFLNHTFPSQLCLGIQLASLHWRDISPSPYGCHILLLFPFPFPFQNKKYYQSIWTRIALHVNYG